VPLANTQLFAIPLWEGDGVFKEKDKSTN